MHGAVPPRHATEGMLGLQSLGVDQSHPLCSLSVPCKENIKEASLIPERPAAHSKVCVRALFISQSPRKAVTATPASRTSTTPRSALCSTHLVTLESLVHNRADADDPLEESCLRTLLDKQGHLDLPCGTWGQGVGELPSLSPTTLARGPSLENDVLVEGSRSALTLLGGEIQAHLSKQLGDP